eukprot:719832-Pyramimonas_sp.AAC.1
MGLAHHLRLGETVESPLQLQDVHSGSANGGFAQYVAVHLRHVVDHRVELQGRADAEAGRADRARGARQAHDEVQRGIMLEHNHEATMVSKVQQIIDAQGHVVGNGCSGWSANAEQVGAASCGRQSQAVVEDAVLRSPDGQAQKTSALADLLRLLLQSPPRCRLCCRCDVSSVAATDVP